MLDVLSRRRTARRTRRFAAARLDVATTALIGRGVWRMYRGRPPWSVGRRRRR